MQEVSEPTSGDGLCIGSCHGDFHASLSSMVYSHTSTVRELWSTPKKHLTALVGFTALLNTDKAIWLWPRS